MERVSFFNQANVKENAEETFKSQKEIINRLIPNLDVQHVGSTAVPNSLTKGDLDIQVRVSEAQFPKAVEVLSAIYEVNEGSVKTNEFRAFKNDSIDPPLGIQLTVIDSEFDKFFKLRDILLENDHHRKQYDELKMKFEGKSMEAYREAKSDFFNMLMQTHEFIKLEANLDKK